MCHTLEDILTKVQPFRDNLFSYLKPNDISNLCTATDIMPTNAEKIKYMSIIRLLPIDLSIIQRAIYEQNEVYVIGHSIEILQNILYSDDETTKYTIPSMSLTVFILNKLEETIELFGGKKEHYTPLQYLTNKNLYKSKQFNIDILTFSKRRPSTSNKLHIKRNNLDASELMHIGKEPKEHEYSAHITKSNYIRLHNEPTAVHKVDYCILDGNICDNPCSAFIYKNRISIVADLRSFTFHF